MRAVADIEPDPAPLAQDRATIEQAHRAARSYVPVMCSHAFFAGRTAAALYGAPVGPAIDIEVAVAAPNRAPRMRGVLGRKIQPELVSVRVIDGLRVSSPASTWAMLGRELSIIELVRLGDAFVRVPRDRLGRPQPARQLTTIDHLRAAATAGRRPGAGKLREALDHIRVGAMSPLETDWRLGAAAAGLPEPQLDVEIRDSQGRLLGIADATYPRFATLVEVEGDHHRTDRRQWERDIEKHAAFTAAGWDVVRVTGRHVRGPSPRAPQLVESALRRHGWSRLDIG